MIFSNQISRAFGKFASKKFPKSIQSFINKTYVNLLMLDMDEFKNPVQYESLNALFTRKLEKPRTFEKNENTFISPCDSLISQCGELKQDILFQIKGFAYELGNLLTNVEDISKLENGEYINFYLSPKDYHRYHAPIDMTITRAIHVPGKLYPVNMRYLNKVNSLFSKNERVILECLTKDEKLFYMVFVGALNVGQMAFNFDTTIATNTSQEATVEKSYENLTLTKGDELGYFKMGSTVVMIFEKDLVNLEVKTNQNIKFTEKIATRK